MLRKVLLAALVSLCALFGAAGAALAASPQGGGSSTVPVLGQATVVQGDFSPELRVKALATDGSGWLLEAALSPVQQSAREGEGDDDDDEGEREEHEGEGRGRTGAAANQNVLLDGAYTLGQEGQPLLTGEAAGQIIQGNVVALQLFNAKGVAVLNVSVTAQAGGSVIGQMEGTLPSLPKPVAAPADSVSTASLAGNVASLPVAPTASAPTSHTFWYISRTAAVVAYLLLFANVCLGLVVSSKGKGGLIAKWRAFDLHQFTALLAMGFLALHVFSLLGDAYFSFGAKELLLPFASPYRPLWTTLGVFSLYAAAVVTFSFYVRQRIGMKAWRAIHYTSFALFIVVLIHGIMAGSDTSAPWMQAVYMATGMAAAGLFLWRFLGSQTPEEPAAGRGERGRMVAAAQVVRE